MDFMCIKQNVKVTIPLRQLFIQDFYSMYVPESTIHLLKTDEFCSSQNSSPTKDN